MEKRQLNVFADAKLDYNIKLALASGLERLYSSLVAEPIPPNLRAFTDCLGRALEQAHGVRARTEKVVAGAERIRAPSSNGGLS